MRDEKLLEGKKQISSFLKYFFEKNLIKMNTFVIIIVPNTVIHVFINYILHSLFLSSFQYIFPSFMHSFLHSFIHYIGSFVHTHTHYTLIAKIS